MNEMNDAEINRLKYIHINNYDLLLNQWLIQIEVQYDLSTFEVYQVYQQRDIWFHQLV